MLMSNHHVKDETSNSHMLSKSIILLRTHQNGIYPGLYPLLREWRNTILDPANVGLEVIIEINSTAELMQDQVELMNFLQNNFGRWHKLLITGVRPFHFKLAVTGNTCISWNAHGIQREPNSPTASDESDDWYCNSDDEDSADVEFTQLY